MRHFWCQPTTAAQEHTIVPLPENCLWVLAHSYDLSRCTLCSVNARVHPARAVSLISSSRHPSNRALEINLSDTDGNISTIRYTRQNGRFIICATETRTRTEVILLVAAGELFQCSTKSLQATERTDGPSGASGEPTPTKRAEDWSMQSRRQRAEHSQAPAERTHIDSWPTHSRL